MLRQAQEGQAATVGSRRREGLLSASCGGVAGRLVRRFVRGALKAVDAGLIRENQRITVSNFVFPKVLKVRRQVSLLPGQA